MTPRKCAVAFGAIAALMLGAPPAYAGTTVFDISGGSQWRSTDEWSVGSQWAIGNFNAADGVAATPFGNSYTRLNSNRMMWYCGAGDLVCLDGGDSGAGPSEVFFGTSFFIKQGATFSGAAAIIADDFFDLVVNGQSVLAAILDAHQTVVNDPLDPFYGTLQPDPLTIDLTPYLHEGDNVLAIRAMDGYLKGQATSCDDFGLGFELATSNLGDFCKGHRELQYMFVSGSVTVIPEPGALSLSSLALLGLGLVCRRPASKAG